ncbi:BQ5605_C003g01869 [Microbotryum silenes-dioicae]|uniref:BQ5605_C003g01869 protein n=1 Tax=Microbotryum silenes-dioicae TaxID=796604 RepID=A0A2X0MUS0_9BASI|nr:BQ5605_C003g01869 [Microbotryum silenes-dioicae]
MAKAKSRLLTLTEDDELTTRCPSLFHSRTFPSCMRETSVGTGFSYIAKRPRTAEKKLAFMKYDPKARKHVLFMEAKLK